MIYCCRLSQAHYTPPILLQHRLFLNVLPTGQAGTTIQSPEQRCDLPLVEAFEIGPPTQLRRSVVLSFTDTQKYHCKSGISPELAGGYAKIDNSIWHSLQWLAFKSIHNSPIHKFVDSSIHPPAFPYVHKPCTTLSIVR